METTESAPQRTPGAILRDLRKVLEPEGTKKVRTQAELAKRLGYIEDYVQAIETGRKPMQFKFVDELARLADEARLPEAFARLMEELREAVAAYWAAKAEAELAAASDGPPPSGAPADNPVPAAAASGNALVAPLGAKLDSLMELSTGRFDALRVAVESLSAKTEGRLDGLGGKVDRTEGTVGALGARLDALSATAKVQLDELSAQVAKLGSTLARTPAQLDTLTSEVTSAREMLADVQAQQGRADQKVDQLGTKLDTLQAGQEKAATQRTESDAKLNHLLGKVSRALWGAGGLAIIAATILVRCHPVPLPSLEVYGAQAREIGGNLGQHKVRLVPHQPLPHQAVAPCRGVATTLYGSCWLKIADQQAPCPPDTYQEGNSCYVPSAADPSTPVGEEPLAPPPPEPR